MEFLNSSDFKLYYSKYSEKQLKNFLDTTYDTLCDKFSSCVSFRFECKELLSAILLLKYDKNLTQNIVFMLCLVFDNKCSTFEFYEYMNTIIDRSIITMNEWIELKNYLETNHKWIDYYKSV